MHQSHGVVQTPAHPARRLGDFFGAARRLAGDALWHLAVLALAVLVLAFGDMDELEIDA